MTSKNKTHYTYIAAMLFLAATLFSGGEALAQSRGDLSISLHPSFPRPNETVTVELTSAAVDLNRAAISWGVDGSAVLSGIGERVLRFTLGPLGSTSQVSVSVESVNGQRFSRSVSVRPAGVDILWEANTYVPPFYKGKALHTIHSTISYVAFPQLAASPDRTISADEVVYTWNQAGVTLGDSSGYGRRRVTLDTEFVPTGLLTVEVSASSLDRNTQAYNIINTPVSNTVARFYIRNPLEGVRYENTLKETVALASDEVTVRAEPYFFANDDIARGNIRYSWFVNNSSARESAEAQEITFRREEVGGVASVSIDIKNANLFRILQRAKAEFFINL